MVEIEREREQADGKEVSQMHKLGKDNTPHMPCTRLPLMKTQYSE